MRVTTDSKHYENMAAKIREKTGTDATYKPSEMPSGVDAVYKAGQSSMVDESKLIPKTVSGNYISVDDVSEIPHSVGCKVESVNLWTLANEYVVTGNAENTHIIATQYCNIKEPTTFSCVVKKEDVESSQNGNLIYLWVTYADKTSRAKTVVDTATNTESVFLLDGSEDNPIVSWHMQKHDRYVSGTITISNIMLNRGTTALLYTPYVSPENVSVTRCGKNMLKYPHKHTTKTVNGITFTDNGDGTVTANGTATADATYYVADYNLKRGITYTFSGCPIGGSKTTYYLNPRGYDYDIGVGKTLTPTYDFANNVEIVIKSGTTVSNLLFKPQWEFGDKATEYEPYKGQQTLTPTADGTVEGFTSVSPYMNIFSDTEGVNIEATYNKSYGMQTEYDRFWDAYQYNTNDYSCRFGGSGWNKNNFKPKCDIKPTFAAYLFWYSNIYGSLTDILSECGVEMDLGNNNSGTYLFYSTKFSELPDLNLSKCVTLQYTFQNSTLLKKTGTIKLPNNPSAYYAPFSGCSALSDISFEGNFIYSISFQWCPLNKASITSVVNALSSTVTGQTLTLSLSAVNTAFETSSGAADGSTSAEFAALVATKTNWTITMV